MEDVWLRIVENMTDRVSGPMHFRLYIQPTMAVIYAVIAGWRDAKAGKPPYFWALFNDPLHRREMLKDGWKSGGKVLVLALVLDMIYQGIVLHWVYPGEAILVAITLAILPYLIMRGLVTRVTRLFGG